MLEETIGLHEPRQTRPHHVGSTSPASLSAVVSLWVARTLTLLLAFPGYLPLGFWVYVQSLAIRARLFLGHWPTYRDPGPYALPEDFHYATGWVDWALATLAVLLAGLVTWYLAGRGDPRKDPRDPYHAWSCTFWMAVRSAATFCLLVLLVHFDPLGAFRWVMD